MTPTQIPEEFREWAKRYADGNSIDGHPRIREHLNAELYEAAINTYRFLSSQGPRQKYFFSQDDSCHWYMIPVERREEWSKARDLNLDTDAGYEDWQKGNWEDYLTGGGINGIEFTIPESPAPIQ